MMVGREVALAASTRRRRVRARSLLEVESPRSRRPRSRAVRGVRFSVRAGEIVGIAGVDGNGQTELVEAISGLRKRTSGRIVMTREETSLQRAYASMLESGVGHIPEDRHAPRARPRLLARREPRASRFPAPARLALRLAASRVMMRVRSGSSRSSTSAGAIRRRRPGRSPAAISRSSSRPERWIATRAYSSPRSRREGSTSVRSSSCTVASSTSATGGGGFCSSPSSSRRSCRSSDRILVIYEGEIVAEHGSGVDAEDTRDRDDRRRGREGVAA